MLAARRRSNENRRGMDTILFPLFVCALGVVSLILSMVHGTGSMFYAGFPIWLSASWLMMTIAGSTAILRYQVRQRIRRRHFNDAMQMVKASLLGALAMGVVMTLLYSVGAWLVATYLFGIRDAYLVLYALAPAAFCGSFIGVLRGILEATGFQRISTISLILLTGLTVLFSLIGAAQMAGRGEQVGALLMNTGYKAVYIAAGAGGGLSAAVVVTFLFLVVMSYFSVKYIRDHQDHLGIDNEEQAGELFVYYFSKVGPYALVGFVPVLLIVIDYRIYCAHLENHAATAYHSEWGGFMGITLPLVVLAVCVSGTLFAQEVRQMSAEYMKEAYKRLRLRFSMVMRISGYFLIPATFYAFGAAKPFVEVFHGGLYGDATDGAVLSLKYMSPLIFLGATMLITGLFYWSCNYQNLVIVSLVFGAAFEIGAMSILGATDLGMNAVPIALDIYAAAYLGCAYYLGRRQLLSRCDSSWILDDLLVFFCAAIAAVPVILLNDYMTTQVYPVIGVIFLFAIFVICYVPIAILLGCTDYGNLARFPGGRYVVQLAILMGRYAE